MSYEYVEKVSVESRKRYLERLQVVNLKECPYRLPEGSWSSGLITWPELQYLDIYDYLINSACMYYSPFHIVYSENLSTAIIYFTYFKGFHWPALCFALSVTHLVYFVSAYVQIF